MAKKILLVEDDNNLREIYEARLQAEGYEIVSARDGEEALTVAMKEKPDLIISDVMMPKISGFDMLDIIRSTEETKNSKVIMMTALSQAEDKERATKLGADRYLVKSQVTLEDVAKVAREVLESDSPGGSGMVSDDSTATPAADDNVASTPAPVAEPPATDPASMAASAVSPSNGNPPTPAPVTPVAENSNSSDNAPTENAVSKLVQTAAEEQDAIAAQIESFIDAKKTNPNPPAPDSSAVPTEPAPADQAEMPAPEATPASEDAGQPKKKVIEPLNDLNKGGIDLNDLVQKEAEKEQMAQIAKELSARSGEKADELTASAQLRAAARDPQAAPPEDTPPAIAPEVQIGADGNVQGSQVQPQETPDAPRPVDTPAPLPAEAEAPAMEVPAAEAEVPAAEPANPQPQPVIPHTQGTSIDGVTPAVVAGPEAAPTPDTAKASGTNPDNIAL